MQLELMDYVPTSSTIPSGVGSPTAVREDLGPTEVSGPPATRDGELDDCQWSPSVALDPKHRPQLWDEPSGTVRREWCRYPQEAHLLDTERWQYRRLSIDEIAILQGFEPSWFDVPGMTRRNRLRGTGDAVPPPLARAVVSSIDGVWRWANRTAAEVCAGSGGLSLGAVEIGLEHLLLVDHWAPAYEILRHEKPWSPDRVVCANVKEFDFTPLRGRVGLLSGGPPCQPWSIGGRRRGTFDPRDLLAWIHELVGTIEPEVFVFENVPGLVGNDNGEYLAEILQRLRQLSDAGPSYGVLAGVLNAADYGVPQIRRRVFIMGFRNRPAAFAHGVFDRIHARATHRDPTIPHPTRQRWRTVRDALGSLPDPGGWRKWITPGVAVRARTSSSGGSR